MRVERWDVFELSFQGPREGNPFVEQWLCGQFHNRNETVQVQGFYDGEGVYRLRFMPSFEGSYTY